MAFVAVPATIKAALIYRAAGNQEIVNTLYFKKSTGSVTFADLGAVSNDLYTWWSNTIKQDLSQDVVLDRIELKDLSIENSFVRVDSYGDNGVDATAIEPLSVTKRINFGTGFGGRSFRGSNYWPAMKVADVTGNIIDGAAIAYMEADYSDLLPGGTYPIPDFDWVVVSRIENGVPRSFGVTTPIIQVYTAGTDVDVMRSRVDP